MEVDNSPQPTIKDSEAFAAKHMPDLGQEVEDFQVQTWRVQNWSASSKRMVGADFLCGGHKWRILIFPQGNANGQPNDMVSVYLDYSNPKAAAEGWHSCAQFALAISNPNDPSVFTVSHAHHRFVAEECDWGFTRFADLRKLQSVQEGQTRPTIEGDEVDVTAFVRVLKDPTGVLWHNFVNYDSKKFTGYVGLKNQGATCYMNSLLQSLYHTPYFRKAVYQIPTEEDTPSESVALALQRVFYNLQTSEQPVGTNELTKSFGWKSLDSFMQHDVQEFNRVLQDKLEEKMKGTKAEGAIQHLFMAKMKSYIKCVDVDYESARSENYYDVQLNVKGMKDLHDSFKDYITVETMDGENKYQAEGYGLQDARKGVIFESFPPVLHLQLKRFEYDMQRDTMVKINDRHEFPFQLDLGDYLDENAERDNNYVYKLHGVLVHAGDLHGGHYFALIKPEKDGKWFKYDDDRVTPVTDKEVLEDNYGGELPSPGGNQPRNNNSNATRPAKRFTNAYMLVYIRESAIDDVLKPFTEDDTPPHLRKRLEDERIQLDTKKREKEEQHLYLTAKIISDDTFRRHQGFDLASFDDKNVPVSELPIFRVLKNETYKTFKGRVAAHYNHPEANFRLWVLVNRQNKTVRPDIPIEDMDSAQTMEQVRNTMANRTAELRLYLDYEPKAEFLQTLHSNHTSHSMIFLKHFDVEGQTLLGSHKLYVLRNSKVGDLQGTINQMLGWAPTTPLKLYEEIKPGMIEVMKMKSTFAVSEIQDGDVICFQVDFGQDKEQEAAASSLIPNAPNFYDHLQNRILTAFKPKGEDADPKATFDVMLTRKMTYEQMAYKVSEALGGWDPLKLRFTSSAGNNNAPKGVIKRSLNQTVQEILHSTYQNPIAMLYYEKLEVSIIELETKKSLKVTWTGHLNKDEGQFPFLLPKTNTIDNLGENLAKLVTLSPTGTGKIRFFEISNLGRRKQHDFSGSEMIGNIQETIDLYAEEVPLEEVNMGEDDTLISVFHFSKEPSRYHGIPFRFVVSPGEKFSETKKRLQARTGASDKDFAKYRFALILQDTSGYKQPNYIEDEDEIHNHKFTNSHYLGIDHMDKTGKSNRGGLEKAIVIR
ncbi:hypothetical protein BDY24DRAFT_406155 [Mrakia frigida]|uniref:ubiquitin-specific protease UBP15 n=1 Tax=Mrakia frigida TaxID=29902 RepID=UPI003FCC14D6